VTAHIIYDNEIKSILEAAEQLFVPEPGKGDDRSMYQQIFHILEDCKTRFVE
jgi:hypothetical protein